MKDLNFKDIKEKPIRDDIQIIKGAIEDNEDDIDTKPTITRSSIAPTGGNDKDLHVDDSANRLYVNVNGTWKYTSLT